MNVSTPATLGKPIEARILVLRGERIMLDADLAELYGVVTKVLIQAVKRNAARFPVDFMFQLAEMSSPTRGHNLPQVGVAAEVHSCTEHQVWIFGIERHYSCRTPRAGRGEADRLA